MAENPLFTLFVETVSTTTAGRIARFDRWQEGVRDHGHGGCGKRRGQSTNDRIATTKGNRHGRGFMEKRSANSGGYALPWR